MKSKVTIAIMTVIIIVSIIFYVYQYQNLCLETTLTMGSYDTVDRGMCFGRKYGIENTTDKSIQIKRYRVRTPENEKYLDTNILEPGDILTIEKNKGYRYEYVKTDTNKDNIELGLVKIK